MATKKRSPRKHGNAGKGQKQNHYLLLNNTTPRQRVKGLELAAYKANRSRVHYLGKIAECEEHLAALRSSPAENAAYLIREIESRLCIAMIKRDEAMNSLSAINYSILALTRGGKE